MPGDGHPPGPSRQPYSSGTVPHGLTRQDGQEGRGAVRRLFPCPCPCHPCEAPGAAPGGQGTPSRAIQAQVMAVLDMLFLKSFPLFFPFTAYTTTHRILHRNSKTVAAQRIQAQACTPLHVALIIRILHPLPAQKLPAQYGFAAGRTCTGLGISLPTSARAHRPGLAGLPTL